MIRKMLKVGCFFCICVLLLSLAGGCSYLRGEETINVFEQIYLDTQRVERGKNSILLSGTESAYADYDVGIFQNIVIPDLQLTIEISNDSLYLYFYNQNEERDTSKSILYRYNRETQTLYGEQSLAYLKDHFLSYYYDWYHNANYPIDYTLESLGNYTFVQQEKVYYT